MVLETKLFSFYIRNAFFQAESVRKQGPRRSHPAGRCQPDRCGRMRGMRTTWDIFCNVVDNYGDIGIAWRLA
ncbi:MAG: elongation factor P maturation arginine rhamnosyltransferase EarP, partial [Thiobacillus sp.]